MTALVTLRAAAASVPGMVRQGNEDAVYAGRWLFAVADGLGGQFRQITEDHVMGNLVSNAGGLAEFIVRFLDGRPDRSPDLILRDLQPGDRYLLCSDGLSPVVADAAVREVLATAADPDVAV